MKNRFSRRPPRIIAGTSEDIIAHLDAHGVQDKDAAANDRACPKKKTIQKSRRGVNRLSIDLHGLTADRAAQAVRSAIDYCESHGMNGLVVIHGKGRHSTPEEGPVLKNLLIMMVEHELQNRVAGYRSGRPAEGGEGVTILSLARKKN